MNRRFIGALAIVFILGLSVCLIYIYNTSSGFLDHREKQLRTSSSLTKCASGDGGEASAPQHPSPQVVDTASGGVGTSVSAKQAGRAAQPVSLVSGHPVAYSGAFVAAAVRVDGKDYHLTPNQVGNFPRIDVKTKDTIHVQVAYPQGQPGDAVVVESEDGGSLDGKKTANITTLDSQQAVEFNFHTTEQPGIYHVALRNGADVKVLNFWAGPEPVVRQ
jgi:hypothetical protein